MRENDVDDILSMTASLLEHYDVEWVMHPLSGSVVFADVEYRYECLAIIETGYNLLNYRKKDYIKFLNDLDRILSRSHNKVRMAFRKWKR